MKLEVTGSHSSRFHGLVPRKTFPQQVSFCLGLAVFNLVCLLGALDVRGEVPEPKYGAKSESIGTFDGWTFWLGWEGAFSDTYSPVEEKYGWIVYFAPEAIYVALESAMATYSGVDVNMGYRYVYGFLKSEAADKTLGWEYRESLRGVILSTEALGAFEGAGPMAHLSMDLEVESGFLRKKGTKPLVPACQRGWGFSVAYSLLPIKLPFKVELDNDTWDTKKSPDPGGSGFWPIVIWKRAQVAGETPVQQVLEGLQDLTRNGNGSPTVAVMAGTLAPVLQQLSQDQDLKSFFSNPRGGGRIGQALLATETWLQTGDTKNVPATIVPTDDKTTPEVAKPILCGTQLAFQTGYRVGAQANPNSKWTYVDGVVTNYCYIGERCRIEIKAKEVSDLIPGTTPANFNKAWIGFSLPQEYMMSYSDINNPWEWMQMTNGVATFDINESFSTPQIVRVRYSDVDSGNWNKGINIELKSHLLIFLDPTDKNGNQIPDFWEQQYGLTNSAAGTDTDRDGATDYQEYLANTDPSNPKDFPKLLLTSSLLKSKKLTIPHTDSARRYTIEANTNATLSSKSWFTVEDFYGEDAASDIDISSYLKATNAFFRLTIRRY
jgi:hypothetical protein